MVSLDPPTQKKKSSMLFTSKDIPIYQGKALALNSGDLYPISRLESNFLCYFGQSYSVLFGEFVLLTGERGTINMAVYHSYERRMDM